MTNNQTQAHEWAPESANEITEPEVGERGAQRFHPRIYVASLADYNSGELRGAWLDADQTVDAIESGIAAMLATSAIPNAEEWAIHDYDDFGGIRLGEYEDLTTISLVAHGLTRFGPAFASWHRLVGHDPEQLQQFEAAYLGNHLSCAEYARELLESLGVTAELDRSVTDHLGERLAAYLRWDYEPLCRDLALNGEIMSCQRDDGSVDVFQGEFL